MPDGQIPFDYLGAKKAGYTDNEIQDYLKKNYSFEFDIIGAKNSGYSDNEIADYITAYESPSKKKVPSILSGAISAATSGRLGGRVGGGSDVAKNVLGVGGVALRNGTQAGNGLLNGGGGGVSDLAKGAEIPKEEVDKSKLLDYLQSTKTPVTHRNMNGLEAKEMLSVWDKIPHKTGTEKLESITGVGTIDNAVGNKLKKESLETKAKEYDSLAIPLAANMPDASNVSAYQNPNFTSTEFSKNEIDKATDFFYKDRIYNEAVKWYASKNPQFAKELEATGIEPDKGVMYKIPDIKLGNIVSQYLSQPDLNAFIEKERPDLYPAFESVSRRLITDNKDYGLNVMANEISQEIQNSGYNNIEPIFNFKKGVKEFGDIVGTGLYQNDPAKIKFYQENKEEILNMLDAPSFFEGFASTIKGAGKGIKNTFTQPFESVSETVRNNWEKEINNVTANPKGLTKFIRDVGSGTGFVASIAAPGGILKAAGLSPKAASAVSITTTFFGDQLEQGVLKYPDNPVKAWTSATLNTTLYAALAYDLFPAEKAAKAMQVVKPEVEQVVKNLSSGAITRETARKEMQTITKKAVDAIGGALKTNTKASLEMAAITAVNKKLDKVFMDENTYDEFHTSNEEAETFKHLFMSNSLVSAMSGYGSMRQRNKLFEESIYNAASNPKQFQREIERLKIANPEINDKELYENLKFVKDVKDLVDGKDMTEQNKKAYLAEALKAKVARDGMKASPEETVLRKYDEQAKRSDEIKEKLLNGEDADKIVTEAEVEANKEKLKDEADRNKLMEKGQKAIDKLLEEKDENDKNVFTGVYRDVAKKDPEGFLEDISEQAFGTSHDGTPLKGGGREKELVKSYGADIVNAAKELFPKKEIQEEPIPDLNFDPETSQPTSEAKAEAPVSGVEGGDVGIKKPEVETPGVFTVERTKIDTGVDFDKNKAVQTEAKKTNTIEGYEFTKTQSLTEQDGLIVKVGSSADAEFVGGTQIFADATTKQTLKKGVHYAGNGWYRADGENGSEVLYSPITNEVVEINHKKGGRVRIATEDFIKNNSRYNDNIAIRGSKYSEAEHNPKFGGSGHYKGTYFYVGMNAESKALEHGKNLTKVDISNANLYEIDGENTTSQSLKNEAKKAGYDTRDASGYPESEYLKKQGYDGIQRGNEIILFEPKKFEVKPKEQSTKVEEQGGGLEAGKSETPQSKAKKVYRDIGEIDEPTDARGLALEYLAGGNKVHESVVDEVANRVKRASLNTGAKEKKSAEVKARDYTSKDAPTIDEIVHSIWDNLSEEVQSRVDIQDLKNELMDVIGSHNTRLSAATEFRDRYLANEVRGQLSESEAREMDDISIKKIHDLLSELPENQQNQLVEVLKEYQDKYGNIDWAKLEKDTNGFNDNILSLPEETQTFLYGLVEKNLQQGQGESNNAGSKDVRSQEKAEELPEEITPPEPPKKPLVDTEGGSGGEGVELSHKGLQDVANEFSLPDVRKRDRKSDIELKKEADELVKEWAEKGQYAKNVEELIKDAEAGEILTDKERVVLERHLANLSAELRGVKDKTSPEFDAKLKEIIRLKEAGEKTRSEAGAALRIPGGGSLPHPVVDFAEAVVTMKEAVGEKDLTPQQKAEVEKMVSDYEQRAKSAEQKVADMEAKFAEMQAQKSSEKTKKSKGEYKSERDNIRKSIKEKWAAASKDGTLTAVAVPYAKQLMAIAPDVAKLVKSYVSEGITEFSEVVKKVHDLIKDLNADISESDVVDVIAGKYDAVKETKLDLVKKLKQIKDQKSAEAIKIRARIKSGDFAKKELPTSWVNNPEFKKKYPKEYKEAIDAIDAREQAKLDFDIAVYKAERAKRSTGRKGIDFARALIATTKAVKSGIDDSAVMMQNIVAMISHPRSAVKALKEHALDALSEKRFRRYLTELHESPIWPLIEKSGLDITDPKSLKEQNKEEIFDNNLLNKDIRIKGKKYNVGKYLTRPFERAFTSLGNAMRVNMFTRIAERMMEEGKTFETHPEEFKSLARVLNTETGRGKLHTQIERASQLVTAGIWSPRLMASRINMLGLSELAPLYGGKGHYAGLHPEVRKMAIADMAKFLGAGVALMAFAGSRGADVDDDPESPTFGTIKVGDKKYNAWGGFTPYAKTIYQSISGHRKVGGQRKEITRAKLIGNFFRSRLTPAASVTTNVMTGSDYSGKPITVGGELANLVAPLSILSMIDAVKKDGMTGILNQGIPSFVGIGVSDERDYQKQPQKFLPKEITQDYEKAMKEGEERAGDYLPNKVGNTLNKEKLSDKDRETIQKYYDEEVKRYLDMYIRDGVGIPEWGDYFSIQSSKEKKKALQSIYDVAREKANEKFYSEPGNEKFAPKEKEEGETDEQDVKAAKERMRKD